MKVKCCICGSERDQDKCVGLTLTEAEAEAIRKLGKEPVKEIFYCNPCYRIATDREQGARLMQGLVQTRLRALGSPKAEEMGARMYDMLIRKSRKAPS